MDNRWERSYPFIKLDNKGMQNILHAFFSDCKVKGYRAIQMGCRNTNYCVSTNKGAYLLRICVPDSKTTDNETLIYHALSPHIKLPKLYDKKIIDGKTCLLYQFIQGVSLTAEQQSYGLSRGVLSQVARAAAKIHDVTGEQLPGFYEAPLPPHGEWFSIFLSKPLLHERLGSGLFAHLSDVIEKRTDYMEVIAAYPSFTHSDFRPANMLIDPNRTVYFVDWEYARFGHRLADIAQFFRYGYLFTQEDKDYFREVYEDYAAMKLPEEWERICTYRDLVNLMQLLCGEEDAPRKYKDLTERIEEAVKALA